MIVVKEIAWLAGIIEGEGCIRFNGTPKIAIKMVDKDIIDRVAKLFGKKPYQELPQRRIHQVQYAVCITGTPAIEWLFTIYTFMGNRKKEQINNAVKQWLTQKSHATRRYAYRL